MTNEILEGFRLYRKYLDDMQAFNNACRVTAKKAKKMFMDEMGINAEWHTDFYVHWLEDKLVNSKV